MSKLYYFKHDYNARSDKKLYKILKYKKVAGIGIYWCLIEMLYEEGGFMKFDDIETIADSIFADKKDVIDIIKNFDLFQDDEYKFWSETVLERLERAKIKSGKARLSALARWQPGSELPTVDMKDYDQLTPDLKRQYLARFSQMREDLPNQNNWIDIIAKRRSKTPKSIKYYLSRFLSECHEKEDIYRNVLEYKSHFINWLNKKLGH